MLFLFKYLVNVKTYVEERIEHKNVRFIESKWTDCHSFKREYLVHYALDVLRNTYRPRLARKLAVIFVIASIY